MAWSAPDHVFRLCRRPNEELETNEDSKEIMLDGWFVYCHSGSLECVLLYTW